MAAGKQYKYKIHEIDANTLAIDSLSIRDIDVVAGFTTSTSVTKEDFPDSNFDAFTVKFGYPMASVPASTLTLAQMLTACSTAIRAKYGDTEVASV